MTICSLVVESCGGALVLWGIKDGAKVLGISVDGTFVLEIGIPLVLKVDVDWTGWTVVLKIIVD